MASARGDQTQTEKGGQTEQQILQGCQGELLPGIWYTCMCVCAQCETRDAKCYHFIAFISAAHIGVENSTVDITTRFNVSVP